MLDMNATSATSPALDRRTAVAALVSDHEDFLIVSGLGGPSRDAIAMTDDADHLFTLGGVMGAAATIGLGLALARPAQRVLVVTGDGELMMNVGSLATIAAAQPRNLAIVCVDNGRFGETGNQVSHTALTVDLEAMAKAAGIPSTRTVVSADEIASAQALLRADGPIFVLLRVGPGVASDATMNWDPMAPRMRMLNHLSTTRDREADPVGRAAQREEAVGARLRGNGR